MLDFPLLAQSSGHNAAVRVTGTVTDLEGEPVPNASVVFYDNSETDIIAGTSTGDDGSFSLSAEEGSYILEISFISLADYKTEIDLTAGEPLDLGTISLQHQQTLLDEVVVEGERSYMEMNFDSRIFNVGQDITSLGGSALDVLDNVPSLTVDFEGNVSLRGNQGVQVLINGRPSNLVRNGTEALSTIPSSMIKEVEVITNPSARYSAEGTAGVINIILIDDVRLGFNGSIQGNTGLPQDHGLGANLNYHVNNINWFLNLDFEYELDPSTGRTFQSFSADTTYAFDERSNSMDRELEGDAYFGADIFLPADQILTAAARISLENEREVTDVFYTDYDLPDPGVYRNIYNEWEIMQQITREDIQENRESDFDVRIQYENQLDGRDHRLTADLDFEFGIGDENSDLTELTNEDSVSPRNQRTFGDEAYREIRLDADYERLLGNNTRLEAGFRFNFDWLENNYVVEELQNGQWITPDENIGISDNFTYFENVNALYSMYSGNMGSFTYQLGVRAENTRIQTELAQTGEGSNQNYLNLFPSLFLTYSFNEQNSIQLSYSRRISRPWSRMLLPFTEISDSRNRRVGNPELKPEFGDSYELGYMRHWGTGSILTSIYYRHRTEVIERVSTIDGQGITTTMPINLATEDSWGLEFTADQTLFENMDLSGSLNIFQSGREGEYQGNVYSSDTGSFTSRIRLRWRFLEGWNFQSYLFFRGGQQTTQGRNAGSMFVGSGISKQLFNERVTLSLNVRDLFNSRQSDREIIQPESYTHSQYNRSGRSFRLGFQYHFGSNEQGRR